MLNARGFAGEKVFEQHRLIFRPNTAGTAEVGHARFRADAGAREKHNCRGVSYARGEDSEIHVILLKRYFFCAGSAGSAAGVVGFAGVVGVAGSAAGGGGAGCMSTTLTSKLR